VSYDGRTGEKVHGRRLPGHLQLQLVELEAGRSSQATLLGRAEITFESLYLSRALAERLRSRRHQLALNSEPGPWNHAQERLVFGPTNSFGPPIRLD
jgi:hypothetical protein